MHKPQEINSLILKLLDPTVSQESLPSEIENPGEIVHKAVTHNVHLHMYAGLLCLSDEILKEKSGINTLFNELKPLYLKNLSYAVRQELAQNNIVTAFHNANIPAVIFRGTAVAKELYGDPYCRTAADIDILIRPSDVLNVDSILQQKGNVRNDNLPLNFWLSRLHHAVYRHTDHKTLIEIHWNFSIPSFFNLSSEEIWEAVISPGSLEARLDPGMTVIMLLMHHHMHAFRELRILTDILWAIRKYEATINWEILAVKIVKAGLAKTTLATAHQIMSLWPDSAKNLAAVRILEEQIKKLTNKRPRVIRYFLKLDMDNKNTYQPFKDKLINRFSLDSRSAFIRSFVKTAFPLPEAVRALYKTKRRWALPFQYIRFITWRLRCWISLLSR